MDLSYRPLGPIQSMGTFPIARGYGPFLSRGRIPHGPRPQTPRPFLSFSFAPDPAIGGQSVLSYRLFVLHGQTVHGCGVFVLLVLSVYRGAPPDISYFCITIDTVGSRARVWVWGRSRSPSFPLFFGPGSESIV